MGGNGLGAAAWTLFRTPRSTDCLILEIGIGRKGQMRRFARMLRPNIAVVTCVGGEHLDHLGSLEGVRKEKSIIVESLPADGLAILNGDDENVMWMRSRTRAHVVSCGRNEEDDFRTVDEKLCFPPPRMEITVENDGDRFRVRSRVIGPAMVFPLLATLALARHRREPRKDVVARLGRVEPHERRMEVVELPHGAWGIVDDRKALTETVLAAFTTMANLPARRKWLVFDRVGSAGPDNLRTAMRDCGAFAGKVFDKILLTAPDSEMRRVFLTAARDSAVAPDAVATVDGDIKAVAEQLRAELEPEDAVLFKGRFASRLQRVPLALQGRNVTCWKPHCDIRGLRCKTCAYLTS